MEHCLHLLIGWSPFSSVLPQGQPVDDSAGGRVLKFLDDFALRGYNSSDGRKENDVFSESMI